MQSDKIVLDAEKEACDGLEDVVTATREEASQLRQVPIIFSK